MSGLTHRDATPGRAQEKRWNDTARQPQTQTKEARVSVVDEGYGSMPQVQQESVMPGTSPSTTPFRLSTSAYSIGSTSESRQLSRPMMGPLRNTLRNLKSNESFERTSIVMGPSSASDKSEAVGSALRMTSLTDLSSQNLLELESMTLEEQGQVLKDSHVERYVSIDSEDDKDSSRSGPRSDSLEKQDISENGSDIVERGEPSAGNLRRWKPVALSRDSISDDNASAESRSSSRRTRSSSEGDSRSLKQRRNGTNGSRSLSSSRHSAGDTRPSDRRDSPSSSSSFTASFSTSSSRKEAYAKLTQSSRTTDKVSVTSSASSGLPTYNYHEDVRKSIYRHQPDSPRPVNNRPNTAPGSQFGSNITTTMPSSRLARTPQYASALQPLNEDSELPSASPLASKNKPRSSDEIVKQQSLSTSSAKSTTSVVTPTPKASGMSRWMSKLPLPRWMSGKKSTDEESSTSTLVVLETSKSPANPSSALKSSKSKMPQIPTPVSGKRSLSAGGVKPKLTHPRILQASKDGQKREQPMAPTSVPSKLKSNQIGNSFKDRLQQSDRSNLISSSRTLEASSYANIWDNEEAARAATANDPENEAWAGAKMRFESRYKVVVQLEKKIIKTDPTNFIVNIKVEKQLGSGGHSTVRLAHRISDNLPVVLKYIRNSSVWHWEINPTTGRKYPLEIHVMRKFSLEDDCPNIIKYLEHFELNGRYIIVMEYLGEEWVDLYDYIELYGPVREDISVEIFQLVVETIMYLYKKGYHHNDIKDENILINLKSRTIKLIDFGSATAVEPFKTCDLFYGTKKFSAPEAVRGEPYYPEAQEVWALGTLLFVLLFKLDPFTNDEEILSTDIGRRIAKYRGIGAGGNSKGPEISDEAVSSLRKMMEKDWNDRVRLEDIFDLPIFRRYD